MADLVTGDGEVVAEDLTTAELNRLRQEGVDVPDPDAGDGGGDGDGADDAPESDEPDADTDPHAGGDDGDDPDHEPDEPDADGGDGGDPGDGDATDEPGDDETPDPADDPTSAGPDGSAEADDGQDSGDGGAGDGQGDGDGQAHGTGDQAGDGDDGDDGCTHGPDTTPDLSPDDLDDLADDGWDDPEADDGDDSADDGQGGSGDGDADPDADPDDADGAGDGAGGDGGESSQPADGADPDDLADRIDDVMDRSDNREALGDRDVDESMDDMSRWEDRLDRAMPDGVDMMGLRKDRDERDRSHLTVKTADEVEATMTQAGLDREIRKKFKEIKRATQPRNAETGSKIDRRRVTRYKQGDKTARDFYLRGGGTETRAARAVGVCLDASGSMTKPADHENPTGPTRIAMAKVATAGLAAACQTIGDDFTASAFRGEHPEGSGKAWAPLITGVDESFQWDHLDTVDAEGGTPMAFGILHAAKRLSLSNKEDKTLFVVCDGAPSSPYYNWDNADVHQETRPNGRPKGRPEHGVANVVEQVRNAGIGVVGVGIGGVREEAMYTMFSEADRTNQDPEDAPYVMTDAGNLPEQLQEAYKTQLDNV